MLLVAFGNKARNGKDTAAAAIEEHYKQKRALHFQYYGDVPSLAKGIKCPAVKIFRLADGVYEEARTKHGMTTKDSPLLQKIGHGRRQEDPECWLRQCYSKILAEPKFEGGIALIPDLRYQNEAAFIKSKGGILVNVRCLNQDGTQYIAPDRPADHPSEIELDGYNWDYQIVSKDPFLTGEYAITLIEYLRGVRG